MGNRVLLCWELGAGSGHLEPLGAIAARLEQSGRHVVIATRHLAATARHPLTRHTETVQAPVMWPPTRPASAFSLADMLMKFGWGRTDELCALLDAWIGIFESVRPQLVVMDHAPTAVLAARVAGIATAVQGNGFLVPPAVSPLPGFLSGRVDERRIERTEAAAVSAVNHAVARYGAPPIDTLADLFPASAAFLSTYPEFDPFGERAGATYYGTPDQRGLGATPEWPDGRGEKVFAYMHPDYPQFPVMLEQLAALGHPTLVVAPGFDAEAGDGPIASNIRVQETHVNLDEVAAECPLVICHAGHGTTARLLRQGIAPIITPCFIEQTLLARRVSGAGLAFAAHPDPSRHDYATMIDAALRGERQHQRARQFAADNPPDAADARFGAMVADMLALVH